MHLCLPERISTGKFCEGFRAGCGLCIRNAETVMMASFSDADEVSWTIGPYYYELASAFLLAFRRISPRRNGCSRAHLEELSVRCDNLVKCEELDGLERTLNIGRAENPVKRSIMDLANSRPPKAAICMYDSVR